MHSTEQEREDRCLSCAESEEWITCDMSDYCSLWQKEDGDDKLDSDLSGSI